MTTPPTSFIAEAAKTAAPANTAGSAKSNAAIPNVVSTPQTAALARAAALDNAARVTIAKLPEHILAISTLPQTAQNAQTVNVKVPPEFTSKTIQNPALALLSPDKKNTEAVLTNTSVAQQSVSITNSQRGDLFTAIIQALKAEGSAASVKGTLTQLDGSSQWALAIPQNAGSSRFVAFEVESTALKNAFRAWLGASVTLTLANSSKHGVTAQLSLAGASHNLSGSDGKIALEQSKLTTQAQKQIVESGLKQNTVSVDLTAQHSHALKRFLPNEVMPSQHVLKNVALLALQPDGKNASRLDIQSANTSAVMRVAFEQAPSDLEALNKQQVAKINKATLIQAQVVGSITASASLTTKNQAASNPETVDTLKDVKGNATALNGSDVHKAIGTLSRVLLSQTGNTSQALSQLLAIVEGKSGATTNPDDGTRALFDKIALQVKGLDAMSAKPSLPMTQGRSPSPQNTNTAQSTKASPIEVTKDVGDKPRLDGAKASAESIDVKDSLKQGHLITLAKMLATQAKVSSSGLINSALRQVTGEGIKADQSVPSSHDVKLSEGVEQQGVSKGTSSQYGNTSPGGLEQGLSQRINQALTANALLTTPLNLTSPVASSNFVQGLVALVQLALAGRAIQRQPSLKSLLDMPDSFVAKTLSNVGATATPSKVGQELNQLDNRQQLLSHLKTLLASHQQTKIANAESRIQGQDSFYYAFPSISQNQLPTELLIQREHEKSHQEQKQRSQRSLWNVTMKLDIGSSGEVLAKSKINDTTITLDLYASNDTILQRLGDTLPYLTRRLLSLGLTIEQSSFQKGHIPKTLSTRPHQIFETCV